MRKIAVNLVPFPRGLECRCDDVSVWALCNQCNPAPKTALPKTSDIFRRSPGLHFFMTGFAPLTSRGSQQYRALTVPDSGNRADAGGPSLISNVEMPRDALQNNVS